MQPSLIWSELGRNSLLQVNAIQMWFTKWMGSQRNFAETASGSGPKKLLINMNMCLFLIIFSVRFLPWTKSTKINILEWHFAWMCLFGNHKIYFVQTKQPLEMEVSINENNKNSRLNLKRTAAAMRNIYC